MPRGKTGTDTIQISTDIYVSEVSSLWLFGNELMVRLNLRTTLNTRSTGDLNTTALLLLVMIERKILERNLPGALPLGTIGEGLNPDEWFRFKSMLSRWQSGWSVSSCLCCSYISNFLILSSNLSSIDVRRRIYNQAMSIIHFSMPFGFCSILLSLSTNDILLAGFITVCDRTGHLGSSTGQDHSRGQARKWG
jgi:hypothetical protein